MTTWNGPWSEGADEWTPELIKQLNPDESDGELWMEFSDMIEYYTHV